MAATVNLTANGISDPFYYRSAESSFGFYGDFDGGSLTIEASFDDGTIVDGSNWMPLKKQDGTILTITSPEVHTISIGKCSLRYILAGGGSPDIKITIRD